MHSTLQNSMDLCTKTHTHGRGSSALSFMQWQLASPAGNSSMGDIHHAHLQFAYSLCPRCFTGNWLPGSTPPKHLSEGFGATLPANFGVSRGLPACFRT